ncbi:hypothetical protein L218DRAFT_876650 [Marasmius fiardii PR-910]|nr:hypothetical protein L218DRAFT_876650 [Marasmius fiardii PR-910]
MLLQVLPANKDFEHAISETLTEILAIADITAAGPIFLALDEANYASHSLEHSFRDTNGRYYPALRVVLATWKHHLERCKVAFVVAGTEIPREHFTGEEWADWHWTSNTGGFDSSEDQRRYISKYLPPTLASDASGKRLLDRMWKWIRGRHRFTAAFVSVLLDNRFYLPHVQLNRYVYKVTDGYRPKDIERVDRGALVEERMLFSPISFDSLGM